MINRNACLRDGVNLVAKHPIRFKLLSLYLVQSISRRNAP